MTDKSKEKEYEKYVAKNIESIDQKVSSLTPNNDSALVYLVRPSSGRGAIYMKEGPKIGLVGSGEYCFIFLKPDNYEFSQFDGEIWKKINLNLEGNKIYYIRTYVKFEAITPEEGIYRLKQSKLSKKCNTIKYLVPQNLRQ